MGKDSAISWCHHTHNRWWGCEKISPGCANCYAAELDKRLGGDNWKVGGPRRFFGPKHLNEPRRWNAAAKDAGVRERVFCGSMMDIAERHVDPEIAERQDALRDSLWEDILATYSLDWLLLTKRPENLAEMLPWGAHGAFAAPFRNVWLGTTVEDRERKERVGVLREIDAAVRFLSCEPLLEDLGELDLRGISWVIAGAESGRRARACEVDWLRGIRDQCAAADVPFFLKQAEGEQRNGVGGTRHIVPLERVRDRSQGAISQGEGSKLKKGGIVELPYLDGIQHAAIPASPAARS